MRLDIYLASHDGVKSREKAQELIKAGQVTVNGVVVTKPAFKVGEEDEIEVSRQKAEASDRKTVEPINLRLKILYEDDACIVIDKPRDVSVHPAPSIPSSEPTILHGAAYLMKERGLPFSAAETLVHRLDKETTGCLLLAKTPEAHLALQKQFADRTVKKTYLALVAGVPKHDEATIDAAIGRSTSNRTKMTVFGGSASRDAKTTYRVLDSSENVALLECDLHTGRTHQIRVHLMSVGHPVLGDATYATKESEKMSAKLKIDVLCLHAWKLSFVSPAHSAVAHVCSPLPSRFASLISQEGLRLAE